jgi:hypothetical protein
MMTIPRALPSLLLSLFSVGLAACGGGGDDDEEEEVEDESAVGLWNGTYRLTGGPTRTFNLIAAPSGQFAGAISPTNATSNDWRFLVGTGDVAIAQLLASGALYSAPGFLLQNGAATAALAAFSGVVAERVSLTGSFTAGGESGTFNLNYNGATDRPASLSLVQGVYATVNSQGTIAITSAGQVTFNSTSGCVGNGTISTISPSLNMYSWSLTISNCASAGSPSGLATLADFNNVQSNLLVMIGAQAAPFYFVGSK